MISTNRHAQQLASLLRAHHITDIVISPGSRSGALVHTFSGCDDFHCRSVVDERSAAYFALGLAQAVGRPVVLLCSSGTATLNYAPAIAEAYHQGIPLIVLTADRPAYWIGQLENQCLNQHEIYRNFVRYSTTLPIDNSDKSLWFATRQINEAILQATSGKPAPVHLNIPFEEPLHEMTEQTLDDVMPCPPKITTLPTQTVLCPETMQALVEQLQQSERILIAVGQAAPNRLNDWLFPVAEALGAVVLAEPLANLSTKNTTPDDTLIWCIESVCKQSNQQPEAFRPDILITCGGQIVSKTMKTFLRASPPRAHYHIGEEDALIDTYQALTHVIKISPERFFQQLNQLISHHVSASQQGEPEGNACEKNMCQNDTHKNHEREAEQVAKSYPQHWLDAQQNITLRYQETLSHEREHLIKEVELRDKKCTDRHAYHAIFHALSTLPSELVVHLGNSSVVRHAMMHPPKQGVTYLSNRGVSGIDGSLSTAVGYASMSSKINTVVLGDLSFLYDSNALWNHYIGGNLRVILVNNGGGNIFSSLETLAQAPSFRPYFFAEHDITGEPFAQAFGLDYYAATSLVSLVRGLEKLYASTRNKPMLLEVFTDVGTR